MAARERKGPVILLGDYNAIIHGRLRGEEGVLGPHKYGFGVDRATHPLWEQGAAQTGN